MYPLGILLITVLAWQSGFSHIRRGVPVSEDEDKKILTLGYRCGDDLCYCRNDKHLASCGQEDKRLSYIPPLPSNITDLRLIDTDLVSINGSSFKNITNLMLIKLVIFGSHKLQIISQGTFGDLKYLMILEISQTDLLPIWSVKDALTCVTKSLRIIRLRYQRWSYVPDDMFDGFENNSIGILEISNNAFLTSFNGTSLLNKLRNQILKLNISGNELEEEKVILPLLPRLQVLDISRNLVLRSVPNFCDNNMQSNLPKLRKLYIEKIGLKRIRQDDFNCLENVRVLYIGRNDIIFLGNYTFSKLPKLNELHLNNMASLTSIHLFALKIPTLEILQFNDNNVDFYHYHNAHAFRDCYNLRELNLNGNQIPAAYDTLYDLLRSHTRLRKLDIGNCGLTSLPINAFTVLYNLKELILSGNRISTWRNETFTPLSRLRTLALDNNLITMINKTSFPFERLTSLRTLALGNNPYACTCDLLWFRKWCKQTKLSLVSYPDEYKCLSPQMYKDTNFVNLNLTSDDCREKNNTMVVIIVLTVMSLLSFIFIFLTYHELPTIRNFIYLLRLRMRGSATINFYQKFTYHGFTIFCKDEIEWIISSLLPQLETIGGFRLCVEERDFTPGSIYSNEIIEKANASQKLLLIVTNNFAKDEWCQWQLELALERIRRQGKESVIVILLKEINSKHMTSSLRYLLRSVPYASWNSGKLQSLFWNVVINSMRSPLRIPPIAVL